MNWRSSFGQWTLNRRQVLTECVVGAEPLKLPVECANCMQPSTVAVRCAGARGSATPALLVPYCSRCYKSLEAGKTRVTLAVCASVLCGVGALLAVPLCALDISRWSYTCLILLASCIPVVVGVALRAKLANGQTASDLAVWFRARTLVGTNASWMAALVANNGGTISSSSGWSQLWTWPAWAASVLLTILAWASYRLFYSMIVVLNLAQGEFQLLVDGRHKVTVGVSSLESADAAVHLTIPAGRHRLEARATAEGELLQAAEVDIDALKQYLFAPGATGQCFWTETVSYGKTQADSEKRRLGSKDGLFVLPARIDTWFASNPPNNDDTFSSGGEMVALRHARCSD
jgi:hypothetical protein